MRDNGGDVIVHVLHNYSPFIFVFVLNADLIEFSSKTISGKFELLDPITDNHTCHGLRDVGSRATNTAASSAVISAM